MTESYGSTTTVNNDAHVRVWVVQIPPAGTYNVKTQGEINGYIGPRVAFGHQSAYGWLVWVFVVLFGIGLLTDLHGVVVAQAIVGTARRDGGPTLFAVWRD